MDVVTSRDGDLLIMVMNREKRAMNAITPGLIADLNAALDEAEKDENITHLLLASANPMVFSVGVEVALFEGQTPDDMIAFIKEAQKFVTRLQYFPKPSVAAINGRAFGGGLELALACDYRVCADRRVSIGLPEAHLGLIACMGGTFNFPRLAGVEKAMELIPSAQHVDHAEALRLGLVDKVVPTAALRSAAAAEVMGKPKAEQAQPESLDTYDAEAVLAAAKEYVQANSGDASNPNVGPIAEKVTEFLLNNHDAKTPAACLANEIAVLPYISQSEDSKEGVRALLEKREPRFSGR